MLAFVRARRAAVVVLENVDELDGVSEAEYSGRKGERIGTPSGREGASAKFMRIAEDMPVNLAEE